MTTDIQSDRYDKTLRRTGGIIGPGSKVAEVLPELFPMFDVENLPGELYLLGGTKLSFGGGSVVGVAAEHPRAQLFNPDSSGALVTITSVIASPRGGSATMRWGLRSTEIGVAIDTQLLRDSRNLLPAQPIAVVRQETAVAVANGTGQARSLNDSPFYLTDPNGIAVLAPGTGFEIGHDSTASGMRYCFYWRERQALESELNLP